MRKERSSSGRSDSAVSETVNEIEALIGRTWEVTDRYDGWCHERSGEKKTLRNDTKRKAH